jgi:hypothetical protein
MLQKLYHNIVILWKWKVHFLTANGEEYFYRENSDILVIFVFDI